MPDVDSKLVTALRQAKNTPMFFGFVAKGASDGALLVAKKKISAKEINEAKAESGGKTVFRGRCVGEGPKMVFELAKEPPGTLAKQLKTIIHRDAGMTMQVETRVAADLEADEEGEGEGEGDGDGDGDGVAPAAPAAPASGVPKAPPAPPAPPTAEGAAVMKRLNGLAGSIKTAMAGPNAAPVQATVGAVQAGIKAKDFAKANAALDQLETLLRPAAPPAPPAPPAADAAAAMKRLNAMTAGIKTAMAGPNAAEVQSLVGAAQAGIKSKDFAKASQSLDQLEPLLTAAPPAAPAAPPAQDAAAVTKRFNALTGDIKAALPGPNGAQIQKQMGAIQAALKSKEVPAAAAALTELEALLASGSAAPAANESQEAEWERRVAAIEPRVLDAKKNRPDEAKWMMMFMSVQDLGADGDFAKALTVLNRLEEMLNRPPQAGAGDKSSKSFVAMQGARVTWDTTRKQVEADLKSLEQAIIADCKAINEDPDQEEEIDLGELAGKTKTLYTILERLDERLLDKLDEALNAQTSELRDQKQQEAVKIIAEYQATVNSDPLVAQIDNSGFMATTIKQTFTNVLNDLASKL